MAGFDEATTVSGNDTHLDGDWFVVGPNGGYVASVVLRALTQAVPDRPPRSLTVHYAQPGAAGPATVTAGVERAGRSMSFLSARLRQGDALVATALAAFGTGRETTRFQDLRPDARSPHTLESLDLPGMEPPIA